MLTDHTPGHHPQVTVYRSAINKPVFTFADQASSSVRHTANRAAPFRYTPLDPAAVTAASKVEIISANSAQMNFLKNIYLAKGIAHTTGLANFLVLVDGCVAGGFIFARDRFVQGDRIYLLSDFALAPRSRLSKLVAMLATCELVIRLLEVRLVQRIDLIMTTAFTTQPVSMKYRGMFDLVSRKPEMLNYASQARASPPVKSTQNGSAGSPATAALATAVVRVKLTDLKLIDKNARYMSGVTFNRLVENIRKDGCLTSLPLVHRKGEAMMLSDTSNTSAAEDHFRRSLEVAHRQRALSWELRTATSVARLRPDRRRRRESRELLAAINGHVSEGVETADPESGRAAPQ